jgi:hypothetical protein
MYAYNQLEGLSKLFAEVPQDPYANAEDVPEVIREVLKYKENLSLEDGEMYDYYATSENEQKKPHLYFDDELPLYAEDFSPSDYALQKEEAKQTIYEKAGFIGDAMRISAAISPTWNSRYDQMAESLATMKQERTYIQQLKETGEYDKMMQEQAEINKQISDTLQSKYTKENYEFLASNLDYVQRLDIAGGANEIKELTAAALKNSTAPEKAAVWSSVSLVPTSDKLGANTLNMIYAFDDEIKSIKSQLDALGWDGKTQSENPAISSLLEKAEYRVMQLRENNVKAYRDSLSSGYTACLGLTKNT